MHQPRTAHGQFLLRILIELRLIAQEQGAHESRCVPGKEFPHKADQMMVQLRRPEARAFFPHAEAHLSFCRGQQVDVPRCIGPVALAVFTVGAGKLRLRLQPLSRRGAAERAAVIIEECMQFWEALRIQPHLRPDIAAVILGIAQQLGTDRPGLSVQELCRKRGDAGVKCKAAQAHSTAQGREGEAAQPVSAQQKQRCARPDADKRRGGQPVSRQQITGKQDRPGKGQAHNGKLPHVSPPQKTASDRSEAVFLIDQMIFSDSLTPPIRWKCRCWTLWPPSSPQLLMTR